MFGIIRLAFTATVVVSSTYAGYRATKCGADRLEQKLEEARFREETDVTEND